MPPADPTSARLAALQRDFASRLLAPGESPPDALRATRPPVRRFAVYRNNVMASLTGAVSARFPVVLRLLGAEFFKGVAREFVTQHPPRAPMLLAYGAEFPEFLRTFEPTADLPYLPDVARLEWLRNVAYHAADRAPLAPAELQRIPADAVACLRFEMHPSAQLFGSDYPAVSIWETNAHDPEVKRIGPELGGEHALVIRPQLEVHVVRLPAGGFALAEALAAGQPLGAAMAHAVAADAALDLPRALALLVGSGFVAGAACDPLPAAHGRDPDQ